MSIRFIHANVYALSANAGTAAGKWFAGTSANAGQDCDTICKSLNRVCDADADWPDSVTMIKQISENNDLKCGMFCNRRDFSENPVFVPAGAQACIKNIDGGEEIANSPQCTYGKQHTRPDALPRCLRKFKGRIRICPCKSVTANTSITTTTTTTATTTITTSKNVFTGTVQRFRLLCLLGW